MHEARVYVYLAFALIGGAYCAVDNAGTEFILAFMDNLVQHRKDHDIELYISTSSNNNVTVNVTTPLYNKSFLSTVYVTRGNIVQANVVGAIKGSGVELGNKTVYVTSSEEITIYCVNKQLYSTDAFTAYPTDTIATEYIAVTWENEPTIVVSALNDNTNVTFEISANYSSSFKYGKSKYTGGDTLTVTLDRYQTFHIYSLHGDLTGTRIMSSQKIAAFSGNKRTRVADVNTHISADHLVEQLVPTRSWGKLFITLPAPERMIGDYCRVVAAANGTAYSLNGTDYTLDAFNFRDHNLPSGEYYWVTSDQGISVAMFSKTISLENKVNGTNRGDPAMSILPPVAQYGSDYTWSTVTDTFGDFYNYIIVVSHTNWTSGLVLDDVNVSAAAWSAVIGNGDYVATYFNVTPGAHNIYNSVPAHGFLGMAYGNSEFNSYAYPSGLRLASINLACTLSATVAADGLDNDCDGRIDEETANGVDDDGDGAIDEDLSAYPRGYWQVKTEAEDKHKTAFSVGNLGFHECNRLSFGLCNAPATFRRVMEKCMVDGVWGAWTAWSSCSITCNSGTESTMRSRTCDNPPPAHNGAGCNGSDTETVTCTSTTPCPVDGSWSVWSWGACSVTCGAGGNQERTRSCDAPAAQYGGADCMGTGAEYVSCNVSDYCLPSFYGNVLLNCGNSSFGCATGVIKCVDIAFRCDGTVDCEDGTDENQYFAGCAASVCRSATGGVYPSKIITIGALLLLLLRQRK